MNYRDHRKPLVASEKISIFVLILLLAVRVAGDYLPYWILRFGTPGQLKSLFAASGYTLTVFLVVLNKERLDLLNIDRSFILILMFGSVMSLFQLGGDLVSIVIVVGLLCWMLQSKLFLHGRSNQYDLLTLFPILVIYMFGLLPAVYYLLVIKNITNLTIIVDSFLQTQIAVVVFEETLFRGALWGYLRRFGLNEWLILCTQSILFWIAHYKYVLLGNSYFFWIFLPIIAISFGLMTLRSRSLTPSTICHYSFNFTALLIKNVF